jgi:hypothetical protein
MNVFSAYQQSAQMRQQASLYDIQAGMLDNQAGAYTKQAGMARAMGGYQAGLSVTRAAQAQMQSELNQGEAAADRRQLVGTGKTAFAANGVLLEGREGSATAMWEQDEAASLAWEQGMIKSNADNEVFGHLADAEMSRAQGRMQAASFMAQAGASRLNASSSLMQAQLTRYQAKNAIINGYAGAIGAGAQTIGQYAAVTA